MASKEGRSSCGQRNRPYRRKKADDCRPSSTQLTGAMSLRFVYVFVVPVLLVHERRRVFLDLILHPRVFP